MNKEKGLDRLAEIKDKKQREMFLEVSSIFYDVLSEYPDFEEIIKKPVSYKLEGKNEWVGDLVDFVINKHKKSWLEHLDAAENVAQYTSRRQLAADIFSDALLLAENLDDEKEGKEAVDEIQGSIVLYLKGEDEIRYRLENEVYSALQLFRR